MYEKYGYKIKGKREPQKLINGLVGVGVNAVWDTLWAYGIDFVDENDARRSCLKRNSRMQLSATPFIDIGNGNEAGEVDKSTLNFRNLNYPPFK